MIEFTILAPMITIFLNYLVQVRGCRVIKFPWVWRWTRKRTKDGFSRRNRRRRDRRNGEIRRIVDNEVTMTGWRYSWILNVILNKFNPGFSRGIQRGMNIHCRYWRTSCFIYALYTSFLLVRSNNRLSTYCFLIPFMLMLFCHSENCH